jgi:hypothetical protein
MFRGVVFDVEGPVQAEVFVLFLAAGQVMLTGPCGADAWYIELAVGQDPLAIVNAVVTSVIGAPLVVHSTSWRTGRNSVMLSFVAVMNAHPRGLPAMPVGRSELARGGRTAAPTTVVAGAVIEHGLRHLAWLLRDDPAIAAALPDWADVLHQYVPEPFRQLMSSPEVRP